MEVLRPYIDSRLSFWYDAVIMPNEPSRTIKGTLATELILELFPLHGALLAAGDSLSSEVGLSSALWQVLGALKEKPRTVSQIGRVMGLTRQSVQRSVNILNEDGLIELLPNPDHQTSPLVRMTGKGEKAYQKVMFLQIEWSNGLGERLKVDDLKVAVQVLRTLLATLENDEK